MEKIPVLSPNGKLEVPSTKVDPKERFLFWGANFFINERPLISYLLPCNERFNLLDNSVALLRTFSSNGVYENPEFFLSLFFYLPLLSLLLLLENFSRERSRSLFLRLLRSRESLESDRYREYLSLPILGSQQVIYFLLYVKGSLNWLDSNIVRIFICKSLLIFDKLIEFIVI